MSGTWPGRRTRLTIALTVLVPLALAGCGSEGGPSSDWARPVDREHQQALNALARWDAAVLERGGAPEFVPTGELTGQIGDWEVAVGENNKLALMAGMIEQQAAIPEGEETGEVRWDDGATQAVEVLSAKDTLVDVRRTATTTCPECVPLMVTAARLSTTRIETSRGPATVPSWEFAIAGTGVVVTRVAVANGNAVVVVPPAWNANDPPVGLSIESATVSEDGRRLTVEFVGAPGSKGERCGADYTGEAVESDLAVVVIVTAQVNPFVGACRLIGAMRTATVDLARGLDGRVVLELREGRPVPVVRAP